jgi:formaldehyde-activating enzyme involved in methanogenesis
LDHSSVIRRKGGVPVLIGKSFIAAVWVDPEASDTVYANNRAATTAALRSGAAGQPQVADVLSAAARPANPFHPAPGPGHGEPR